MAIIKCKMCGGELNIVDLSFVAECEYCGTKQTIPALDDDKKLKMFERANKLRATCEFDKASGIYESIVEDYPEEAEAYWGLILCKYGIEYVDDPATGNKIPTCHRSSFDSVMDDPNFDMVMENADSIAVDVYRNEAKQIEEIRKGIIQVSNQEQPYDIFICYKETDENGERTVDSVIAQDVYKELTREGYRVFFSRITLEDKLGQEYEPYIFAALNSAKVMLAFGTDYKYYNAVWVKNEWSRYLKLIAAGQKKTLIPCYKGIDAYDMPKEFARLQAQDMDKIGAIQDLLHGIEKLIGKKNSQQTVVQMTGNTGANLSMGNMYLNEGSWEKADENFKQAIANEGESADAYLGMFLAKHQYKSLNDIKTQTEANLDCVEPKVIRLNFDRKQREWNSFVNENVIDEYLSDNELQGLFQIKSEYKSSVEAYSNISDQVHALFEGDEYFSQALKLATDDKKQAIEGELQQIYDVVENKISYAKQKDEDSEKLLRDKVDIDIQQAKDKATKLYQEADQRREADYDRLSKDKKRYFADKDLDNIGKLQQQFVKLGRYKDSQNLARECGEFKDKLINKSKKKKMLIISSIAAVAVIAIVAVVIVKVKVIDPKNKYELAMSYVEAGQCEKGRELFLELGDYKDAPEQATNALVSEALKIYDTTGVMTEGLAYLEQFNDEQLLQEYKYKVAERLVDENAYGQAVAIYNNLGDYKDSSAKIDEAWCNGAIYSVSIGKLNMADGMMEKISNLEYKAKIAEIIDMLRVSEELYELQLDFCMRRNMKECLKSMMNVCIAWESIDVSSMPFLEMNLEEKEVSSKVLYMDYLRRYCYYKVNDTKTELNLDQEMIDYYKKIRDEDYSAFFEEMSEIGGVDANDLEEIKKELDSYIQ